MREYDRCLEILRRDYGQCYLIGNYMLCPEKKLIRVGRKFGTETIDAFGFFPEPSLKYDEETIVIFAGNVFLLDKKKKIDWRTVRLLALRTEYSSEFTDGKDLYEIQYGEVNKKGGFNEGTYKPPADNTPQGKLFPNEWDFGDEIDDEDWEEPEIPENYKDRVALGCQYHVEYYALEDTFYYIDIPIFEEFDVPNLRTIVSKSGFETNYITDGKKVLFGGPAGGYSSVEKDGKEYVVVEDRLVKGIDFDSMRVLGEDILVDKNALYYCTEVIPFDKLDGFKFIFREI
jgi:hypothetical protein